MSTELKRLEIGASFSGRSKLIDQRALDAFSDAARHFEYAPAIFSRSGRNFHNDDRMAQELGFPRAVAHAHQAMAYISELLTDLLGAQWAVGGKMSLNCIGLILRDDVLTAKATVKEKVPEGSSARVTFEAWCENQRGEKVVAGAATCLASM